MNVQDDADAGKRGAATAAAALVKDGMVLGIGTGSTVRFLIERLGRRIESEQLRIAGVATSVETEQRARAAGIPLGELTPGRGLDLAIDGADEVEQGTLSLIKGLGGALLREKIVASAARDFVVVADESKLVAALGTRAPVPVEVVRFAHPATACRLERLACDRRRRETLAQTTSEIRVGLHSQLGTDLGPRAVLRRTAGGDPFVTDNGNLIYDLHGLAPIADPQALERDLALIPGVVESGVFTLRVGCVFIGSRDGTVRKLEPRGKDRPITGTPH
ncbi:MAG: ribose-5-phosphate isomerase RpiA [Acetobacteraceae bacterium]